MEGSNTKMTDVNSRIGFQVLDECYFRKHFRIAVLSSIDGISYMCMHTMSFSSNYDFQERLARLIMNTTNTLFSFIQLLIKVNNKYACHIRIV